MINTAMDLRDTYLYLVRRSAQGENCGLKNICITNIDPAIERIPEIEPFSYILIDRKADSIFNHYYRPYLDSIKRGDIVRLPRETCVESVRFDGSLNITFRKARLFPTIYIDFLVIEKLARDLGANKVSLCFAKLSNNVTAPYFKAAIDALGISEACLSCIRTIQRMTKMYYDIVELKYFPRMGHFLKLAAFYFAHVHRIISRNEARLLYYYLRYKNSLDSRVRKGADYGEAIHRKVLSRIRSNSPE